MKLLMKYTSPVQRFQTMETKKWEISPRLNVVIANVWGAGQMKNQEIIENVRKILSGDGSQKREVSGQNGRVGISACTTNPAYTVKPPRV